MLNLQRQLTYLTSYSLQHPKKVGNECCLLPMQTQRKGVSCRFRRSGDWADITPESGTTVEFSMPVIYFSH